MFEYFSKMYGNSSIPIETVPKKVATTCTEDGHRLPKQALQYKPKGRRNIGRPRKRRRDQLHFEDQGTGNTPNPSGT